MGGGKVSISGRLFQLSCCWDNLSTLKTLHSSCRNCSFEALNLHYFDLYFGEVSVIRLDTENRTLIL